MSEQEENNGNAIEMKNSNQQDELKQLVRENISVLQGRLSKMLDFFSDLPEDTIKEEPVSDNEVRVDKNGEKLAEEVCQEVVEKKEVKKYASEVFIGFTSSSDESDLDVSDTNFAANYCKPEIGENSKLNEIGENSKSNKHDKINKKSSPIKTIKSKQTINTKKPIKSNIKIEPCVKAEVVKSENVILEDVKPLVNKEGLDVNNYKMENLFNNSVERSINDENLDSAKKYVCDYCSKRFRHINFLRRHVKLHLDQHKISRCAFCSRKISDPIKLKKHVKKHFLQNTIICPKCGQKFLRRANLTRHERICGTIDKPSPILCTFCGFLCKSNYQLQKHMLQHTNERPHLCKFCPKTFRTANTLKEHEQRMHTEIKPYVCTLCDRGFSTCSDLTKHEKRHEKPNFKMYNVTNRKIERCYICCRQVVNLNTHMFMHTVKINDSATCDICGKFFKSKSSIFSHMTLHFEGPKYSCDICNRKFNRRENMYSHRIRHQNILYKPKVHYDA